MASESTPNQFSRTRQDHRREVAEDYVELIAALLELKGEARTVDLAERLGVSHVTVSRTIQRLVRDGLVTSERYRSIFLTDSGREMAKVASERHQLVVEFLIATGDWSCPALYTAAKELADGYPDPKTGDCTAISSAFKFDALPAFVLHEKNTAAQ